MSYSIEYNRQFIRTSTGFLPLVLMGPNNVYETDRRRARSWQVLSSKLFNLPLDRMLFIASSELMSSFDQQWVRGGQYITNSGFLSWIRSGCASACNIEDFRLFNRYCGFSVSVHLYDQNAYGKTVLTENPKTTEELDAWCAKAEALIASVGRDKAYYDVSFGSEEFTHPPVGNGCYALNMGPCGNARRMWYTSPTSSESDPKAALILTVDEWRDRVGTDPIIPYRDSTPQFVLVNDERVFRGEAGVVIEVVGGPYKGSYIHGLSRSRCRFCGSKASARVYNTRATAEASRKNLEGKYPVLAGNLSLAEI